jgi:hypothetical protein
MDGGPVSAAAVGAVFNATLRISQVVYELKAVGEQARDLLDSTEHVSNSLETTKVLRRQKSMHLDTTEKEWIDKVIVDAGKTLNNVAALIEPVRVDMQTGFGRVGLINRGIFVFRDSPKVNTNLTRLNITSQSLNTALNILCNREGQARSPSLHTSSPEKRPCSLSLNCAGSSPPTYEESEFLNRRRRSSRLSKIPSNSSTNLPADDRVPIPGETSRTIVSEAITLSSDEAETPYGKNVSRRSSQIGFDQGKNEVEQIVTSGEVVPTPIEENGLHVSVSPASLHTQARPQSSELRAFMNLSDEKIPVVDDWEPRVPQGSYRPYHPRWDSPTQRHQQEHERSYTWQLPQAQQHPPQPHREVPPYQPNSVPNIVSMPDPGLASRRHHSLPDPELHLGIPNSPQTPPYPLDQRPQQQHRHSTPSVLLTPPASSDSRSTQPSFPLTPASSSTRRYSGKDRRRAWLEHQCG